MRAIELFTTQCGAHNLCNLVPRLYSQLFTVSPYLLVYNFVEILGGAWGQGYNLCSYSVMTSYTCMHIGVACPVTGVPQLMFVVQLLSTKDTTMLYLPLSVHHLFPVGLWSREEHSKGLRTVYMHYASHGTDALRQS